MGLLKEATKTPLRELQAFVAEMGETVHTTTVAQVLHQSQLYGRVAKTKPLLKKNLTRRHVGVSEVKWKKVVWSVRPKCSLLAVRLDHRLFGM